MLSSGVHARADATLEYEKVGGTAARHRLAHRGHDVVSDTPEDAVVEHPVLERLTSGITLAEGARRGGAWMAGASLGTQVFQFMVSILMARLLFPGQFGEAAIVYSIAGFAQIFTDLGIGAAVVHAKRVTEDLLSSAFWLNALTGIGLTLLLCALSVPLSMIYGQPRLVGLMIVVSLNFTLSFGTVPLALLERSFNFPRIAVIETGSSVIAIVAAPVFVVLGFGVYSLVLGPLVGTIVLSVWLWAAVWWWPRRWASRRAIHELWAFSRGLVGFNAVNYWARNLDNVLLGGTVSSAQLGEYNRSYNLMMIPVGQIGAVLVRVLYPALTDAGRAQAPRPRLEPRRGRRHELDQPSVDRDDRGDRAGPGQGCLWSALDRHGSDLAASVAGRGSADPRRFDGRTVPGGRTDRSAVQAWPDRHGLHDRRDPCRPAVGDHRGGHGDPDQLVDLPADRGRATRPGP